MRLVRVLWPKKVGRAEACRERTCNDGFLECMTSTSVLREKLAQRAELVRSETRFVALRVEGVAEREGRVTLISD